MLFSGVIELVKLTAWPCQRHLQKSRNLFACLLYGFEEKLVHLIKLIWRIILLQYHFTFTQEWTFVPITPLFDLLFFGTIDFF